jgi:hypothetical protein
LNRALVKVRVDADRLLELRQRIVQFAFRFQKFPKSFHAIGCSGPRRNASRQWLIADAMSSGSIGRHAPQWRTRPARIVRRIVKTNRDGRSPTWSTSSMARRLALKNARLASR